MTDIVIGEEIKNATEMREWKSEYAPIPRLRKKLEENPYTFPDPVTGEWRQVPVEKLKKNKVTDVED